MKGTTLIEIMIVALSIALLLLVLYQTFFAGADYASAETTDASLSGAGRQLMESLLLDLGNAGLATFSPPTPQQSTSVSFRTNVGFANGKILFGDPIRYEFQYAPGEVDNQMDDNGDGRIDEGVLTRTERGDTVILCRDIAENGFSVTQSGSRMEIQLALQKVDAKGRVVNRTRKLAVQVRN